MTFKQILTEIKKVLSYSKARHFIEFDDDIYHEISGFKAKIVNFVNLLYKWVSPELLYDAINSIDNELLNGDIYIKMPNCKE